MALPSARSIQWIRNYLRYVDYIGAAQLYLKDNFFLEKPLRPEHLKGRILGHWGTVPGLNLIYASLNHLIVKEKCEMLMIIGPGHGAPSTLANVFTEGSLHEVYPEYTVDGEGMGRIIKDFSWPYTKFPSHVTPSVPGSILEGGELGYSLATAFGAVLDNPNLIAAVAVGDGEAETGPIATAWHSNKFLNPKTSGAVLPIVHINGFKISNPTLFGTMGDDELKQLFIGYGYDPIFVKGANLDVQMLQATDSAYKKIRAIQVAARRSNKMMKPKWPVILLRSPKGWKGIHQFGGQRIEGTFHAHGVPIENPQKNDAERVAIEQWLRSYRVQELVDKNGRPKKELLEFVPKGKLRMGMNPHAVGGNIRKDLKFPASNAIQVKLKGRGKLHASSVGEAAKLLRDLFTLNPTNFRMFCPDELESNKLGEIFKVTKRAYVWPIPAGAEYLAPDGRAMEMLSEHTLQGWMQGYLLTGRYGVFSSYEAFMMIIASMVDQYAKFLKQSFRVKWRKPVPSAVYLLTSVGWRQEHNGFSHQNPGFVSNVLEKHGEFCQIYYPADANSLIVAFEETLKKTNSICVIVADKRPLPQWLSLKEAREQAKKGLGVWTWVGGRLASFNPDVVLASAGDSITQEALHAVRLCKELLPELKIRYVNVSELTALCLGDYCKHEDCTCMGEKALAKYFTADRPVVFSYHGYTHDIEHILWPYENSTRFSLHGYREQGSTTTPFDMMVRNGVSCYQIAIDLIQRGAARNKAVAKKMKKVIRDLEQRIEDHKKYIRLHDDDPASVKEFTW